MLPKVLIAAVIGIAAPVFSGMSTGTVNVPGGEYVRPFQPKGQKEKVRVESFRIDARPVSNAEYAAFVRSHPRWSKSGVKRLFADTGYLSAWKIDSRTSPDVKPPRGAADKPVTEISWFAANEYCASVGKRLPTTREWEWAGRSQATGRPQATMHAGAQGLDTAGFRVADRAGHVWEWTADFNREGPGTDSSFFCGAAGKATADGVDYNTYMRFAFRSSLKPEFTVSSLGFRCAEPSDKSEGIVSNMETLDEPSATALPDSSLYQLPSAWTTDQGRKLRLADLRGKPRIITLFFGHCESACPMVLGKLKSIEAALPAGWPARMGFVMVTLDPRRDDAGGLADYRRRSGLQADGWTLLRGNTEDTRELAMALGVEYGASDKNQGIEHNAVMVLLDEDGKAITRQAGNDEGDGLLKALLARISAAGIPSARR